MALCQRLRVTLFLIFHAIALPAVIDAGRYCGEDRRLRYMTLFDAATPSSRWLRCHDADGDVALRFVGATPLVSRRHYRFFASMPPSLLRHTPYELLYFHGHFDTPRSYATCLAAHRYGITLFAY